MCLCFCSRFVFIMLTQDFASAVLGFFFICQTYIIVVWYCSLKAWVDFKSLLVWCIHVQVSGFCSDRCPFKFCQHVKIPGKQSILLHKISSRTWTTLSQNVCIFIHVIGTRLLTLSPALLLFFLFCFVLFSMWCVIKKQITFLISFSKQNAFCLSCSVISGLKEGSKSISTNPRSLLWSACSLFVITFKHFSLKYYCFDSHKGL